MRIFDFMDPIEQTDAHGARSYLFALAVTALAAVLQNTLTAATFPFPLLFYVPAIGLATLYGGAGPGVLAAVLSALGVFHFAWPGSYVGMQGWALVLPYSAYAVVIAGYIFVISALRTRFAEMRRQHAETEAELNSLDGKLRALQHRMTSNMQAVASLLTLEKMKLRWDPGAVRVLEDARQRVVEMSRISRRLNERVMEGLEIEDYLQLLCADFQSAAASHEIVSVVSNDVDIKDPEKLMALSVLIGEAIGNALKHAFPDKHVGTIFVALKRITPTSCRLIVQDDGCGLPQHIDLADPATSGFLIMQAMAVQIGGKLETLPSSQGTTLSVRFDA